MSIRVIYLIGGVQKMKRLIALIKILITVALITWLIIRYILKEPADKLLTNICTVEEIMTHDTLNDISLTACVIDDTVFDLFYMRSDSEATFTLDTYYNDYTVYLIYFAESDTYSVTVKNDTGTCSYINSFSSGLDACSDDTDSTKDYVLGLFEDFTGYLGLESYVDLAGFFDEYIEANS